MPPATPRRHTAAVAVIVSLVVLLDAAAGRCGRGSVGFGCPESASLGSLGIPIGGYTPCCIDRAARRT